MRCISMDIQLGKEGYCTSKTCLFSQSTEVSGICLFLPQHFTLRSIYESNLKFLTNFLSLKCVLFLFRLSWIYTKVEYF